MMKIFNIILLICCFSCVFAQKKEKDAKEVYKDALTLFPDSLVSHFPKQRTENMASVAICYPGGARISHIYTIFVFDELEVDNTKKYIDSISVAQYSFSDSCLLMTDCNTPWYTPVLENLKQCDDEDNIYPVSNFNFLNEYSLDNDFFEDAVIYVIDANKGEFLEKNFLWDTGVGLSDNWKHGYTRGVLISGKIIAFWLEIW